jgi:DNA polymerase I
MAQPKRLFVVDAMAMAFRSFHAFSVRPLSTSSGLPTSAVYGSALFLLKLIDDEKPDYLVFATDTAAPTFRHQMFPQYKAHRDEMPEDLARQLPWIFKLFDALGCKTLRTEGFEADDLIGTLVKQAAASTSPITSYIVSGDKDFLQLVNDRIFLYAPKKQEAAQVIGIEGVRERFACDPQHVVDALAIIGDSADNVPGVPGIGEKGAAKLIGTWGSLENIYAHLHEITNKRQREALENNKEQAFLSRELLKIKTDCEIPWSLDDFKVDLSKTNANPELLKLFEELEFRSLAQRVSNELRARSTVEPHQSSSRATPPSGELVFPVLPDDPEDPLEAPPKDTIDVTLSRPALRPGYRLIKNKADLEVLLKDLTTAPQIAFDTETTGLHVVTDRAIGVSLSWTKGVAAYLPLVPQHLEDMEPEYVIRSLGPIFSNPKCVLIAHNAKFDVQMLRNVGINVGIKMGVDVSPPLFDTMIASWLLDSVSREHGLDACAMRLLGMRKIPTQALIGPGKAASMLAVPLLALADYACEDADATLQIHDLLRPQLVQAGLTSVMTEIEMPLVPILARMEQEGIYVDAETLDELSTKLDTRTKELEKHIHELAGEDFNIQSTKQLQRILFEKLKVHETVGVTRLKKTKTGWSTDVSVLEALSEHPLPHALLEFRTVTKLKSTYVDALPQLICPQTSRIHTSFHQIGTATGRLSSSDPNLQNIPIRTPQGREIRKAFRPQNKDSVIISADYSQVELRILAHIAREEALALAFQRGEDIHTATAARIFGVAPSAVDATLRSRAKAINFGIIYGMGPQRLARETGVTMPEAKSFIEKYFAGYPRIRSWIDEAVANARQLGYTTTITGRRRPVPEFNSSDRMAIVNAENIAVNSPIQGSAADLIKIAMIRIQKELADTGLPARMLLQVHDELVFECPRQHSDEAAAMIRSSMEHAMKLDVPLLVEVGIGSNWLEAH